MHEQTCFPINRATGQNSYKSSVNVVPYSRKFSWYAYFAIESLIRIFADKISRIAYDEASFQLNMMLSSEFMLLNFRC